jgi:hypothetical protein
VPKTSDPAAQLTALNEDRDERPSYYNDWANGFLDTLTKLHEEGHLDRATAKQLDKLQELYDRL